MIIAYNGSLPLERVIATQAGHPPYLVSLETTLEPLTFKVTHQQRGIVTGIAINSTSHWSSGARVKVYIDSERIEVT